MKSLPPMTKIFSLSLIGALGLADHASAMTMTANEVLTNFNLVTFGNHHSGSSEIEGAGIVLGDYHSQGSSNVAVHGHTANVGGKDYSLIVGGNVTGSGINMGGSGSPAMAVVGDYNASNLNNNTSNGAVYVGGNFDAQYNRNGKPAMERLLTGGTDKDGIQDGIDGKGTTDPTFFDAIVPANLVSIMSDLSDNLAAKGGTAVSASGNTLSLTGSVAGGAQFFTLSISDLFNQNLNLDFDLGTADALILNVIGSGNGNNKIYGNAVGTTTSLASKILWNFIDTPKLAFQRQWFGTVLATDASVTNSTPIEGTLVAASTKLSGELHHDPFAMNVDLLFPPESGAQVPLPSSLPLLAAGAGVLFAMRRRQKKA